MRAGIFDAVADPPGEDVYVLTAKADELEPAVQELDSWSRRWILRGPDRRRACALGSSDDRFGATRSRSRSPCWARSPSRRGAHPSTTCPPGSQRLLVFLALHHRAIARIVLAGTMWPDVSDERAGIGLRSALARLDATTREAVDYGGRERWDSPRG